MSLLKLDNLSIKTPEGRLLSRGICFELNENEILVIKGENGVGKTTLLRSILKPSKENFACIKTATNSLKIDYLPQVQSSSFHIPMTLWDTLRLSLSNIETEEALSYGLLEPRHLKLHWNTASGGEQKRVLLTRMLLKDPDILILDEPLNHLDSESRDAICKALCQFVSRKNKAILMVSHDLKSLKQFAEDKIRYLEIKR